MLIKARQHDVIWPAGPAREFFDVCRETVRDEVVTLALAKFFPSQIADRDAVVALLEKLPDEVVAELFDCADENARELLKRRFKERGWL